MLFNEVNVNHRIIARLDIKGPNLVKGIQLEGLRVIGNPQNFADFYFHNEIDELIYMDTVASLYERNSLVELIKKTAKTIFIPLTVGGGIRSINDITNVLRAGADKVAINTAAVKNSGFIKEASERFGSSTIVVGIEAIKNNDGRYYAYIDNARQSTGLDVIHWAKKAEELGAGEILLTSVDKEGLGTGFDLELIKKVSETVNIPVIAHGGCGHADHIYEAIKNGGASAVAIASLLHYNTFKLMDTNLIEKSEGNRKFIESNKSYLNFQKISIQSIKAYLKEKGIEVRG